MTDPAFVVIDNKAILCATLINLSQLNLTVREHCAGLITKSSSIEEVDSPETIRIYSTLSLKKRAQLENWFIDPVEIKYASSQD